MRQVKRKGAEANTIAQEKRGVLHEIYRNKVLFLMLLPGTIYLIINNYLPMFGVFIAFKDINYSKGIFGSDWVGFDNFRVFLDSPYAGIVMRNTFLYNSVFIILGVVVPVALAIMLSELRNKRAAKLYQSAMFLPYFLSWIVVSYIVFGFLGLEYGYVNNSLLKALGIKPIQWYSETKYWPFLLTLAHMWKGVGYNCVVYLASIVGIDSTFYEAALLDGASKWQQTKYITIPSLMPIIIIMTLMAIGKIFNADFDLFYQVPMNAGALFPVTNVIDTYVYRAGIATGDIGLGAAAGLFQSIIGFTLVMITNGIIKKIDGEKSLF